VVRIGDGWLRLMRFDFTREPARLTVRTCSSYIHSASRGLPRCADWYRVAEQPQMSETEFHDADDFAIELTGFAERFGRGRQ